MSDNNITAFVDSVGRVIVGRAASAESTDSQLAISNPAVVNINVNQESGQISVQLLPYIFREFITADKRYEKHTWKFNRNQITTSDSIDIDEAVSNQYVGIFETEPVPPVVEEPTAESESATVELFDESDDTKPEKDS